MTYVGSPGDPTGERLAGRADGVNPSCAVMPDPFQGVAPAGLLGGKAGPHPGP